jgi:predicted CoA-binding protein
MQCLIPDPTATSDDIKALLGKTRTVAIVGISHKEERDSNMVAKYLKDHGYKIIPVNPKYREVLGETCYPDLKSIPEHVDIVDIFRNIEAIPAIVDEAISIQAGAVWMQQGLEHNEAAEKAKCAGLSVIMNNCIKTEHTRLFPEPS